MIQINYTPATIDDFKAALAAIREFGFSASPSVSAPAISNSNGGERGEFESAYIAKVGKSRFRLSQDEISRGLTREQAAKERLDALENGSPIPDPESVDFGEAEI